MGGGVLKTRGALWGSRLALSVCDFRLRSLSGDTLGFGGFGRIEFHGVERVKGFGVLEFRTKGV